MAPLRRLCVAVAFVGGVAACLGAQQPQPARPTGVPRPPDPGPLFFSEHWKNPKTYEAGTLPLTSVTQDVVTTPDLELTVYDPNAKYIPEYKKSLRWGSWAEDWERATSKVDEIGWTQLTPGSGHGAGGVAAGSRVPRAHRSAG